MPRPDGKNSANAGVVFLKFAAYNQAPSLYVGVTLFCVYSDIVIIAFPANNVIFVISGNALVIP